MVDELKHIGTPRHSGRYPWGSGKDPEQRNTSWIGNVRKLQDQGLNDMEVAKALGMNSSEFRNRRSIELAAEKRSNIAMAKRLKEKGMSTVAIGERMGKNESVVRSWLNPSAQDKAEVIANIADVLKKRADEARYLDIGEGVEQLMGVNATKFKAGIALAKADGYEQQRVHVMQPGTGKYTIMKVLVPPGTPYYNKYTDKIKLINEYSEDGGRTLLGLETPVSVDSKRIHVLYGDEGGSAKDGVIELRRGVDDLSLGKARYAQVRIEVDGTHYMKGMAMYSDDVPNGKDIIYNTNKPKGSPKDKVFKPLKEDRKNPGDIDPDNPFGAVVRQKHYIDSKGKEQLSPINIVGTNGKIKEEGAWETFSRNLSSQVLSKQSPALAKKQLGMAFDFKKEEFDEIQKCTNPSVKKRLLDSFADDCDAATFHLKAAALPQQSTHVLLPILSMSEKEVYAPNYDNGDHVVLIRHPHGGIFEIPELVVNNRNPEAERLIKGAKDAVGIHPKVAQKLSGADFDGDDVIVISNKNRDIKTSDSIKSLMEFDTKSAYPLPDSAPKMKPATKQLEMGKISNLITDMTIKGANENEIVRAVKHSMVVIDAEKHHLDYKLSAIDNNIAALKKLYQGREDAGSSTLISKAGADVRVPHRKDRGATSTPARINPKTGEVYGNTDPLTGKKVYKYTGETYKAPIYKIDKTTGEKVYSGLTRILPRLTKSKGMLEKENARELISDANTKIENVYADHANALKSLANKARKASLEIQYTEYSHSASKTYAKEVQALTSALNIAYRNKPLERQAILAANRKISVERQADPHMEAKELKNLRGQALEEARRRVGAGKQKIEISDRQWEAIQAGAITKSRLSQILLNTDLKKLKERAMPRTPKGMLPARITRAKSMLANGYTRAEVSNALGVSITTLENAIA